MRRFILIAAIAASVVACSQPKDAGNSQLTSNDSTATSNDTAAGGNDAEAMAPPPPQNSYDPSAVVGMARVDNKAYFLWGAKWQTNTIPVCWNSAAEAARPEAVWVRDAVTRTWQAASAVRFIGWGTCAANATGIRISIDDSGPHTKGLGTQINNNPNGMVLNRIFAKWGIACAAPEAKRESCVRSIAVHEFGHALGFAHEQNRPDTPGECLKPAQGGNGDVMLTPWDIHSVMNYCNPVYNNNAQLSELDRQAVARVYK